MTVIYREKIYRSLPLIYNHLMRKIRYDYWADYIFRLTSKYITKNASVLELAAGNCRLADYLIKIIRLNNKPVHQLLDLIFWLRARSTPI